MPRSAPMQNTRTVAEYTHIGAYFRDLREHYRLSVQQVSDRLHIRAKYLEAIEAGDMQALPGKVYTQGYIQHYAEFLGLDPQAVMEHYQGLEDGTGRERFKVTEPTQQQGIPAWRPVLLLLLLGLAAYIGWEHWQNAPGDEPQQRIEPVPERIRNKADNALLLTPKNRACLALNASPRLLPCYYRDDERIRAPFVMEPVRSVMELRP